MHSRILFLHDLCPNRPARVEGTRHSKMRMEIRKRSLVVPLQSMSNVRLMCIGKCRSRVPGIGKPNSTICVGEAAAVHGVVLGCESRHPAGLNKLGQTRPLREESIGIEPIADLGRNYVV
jgi:hypothetical protein